METVVLSKGSEDSGLCLMLKGILDESASRHNGALPVLGSRIGIDAPDAGAQATLVFGGGRCTIEESLVDPDLIVVAGSEILPRLSEVPLRFGLPWLWSRTGRELMLAILQGDLRVQGILRVATAPVRLLRASFDLLLLLRLLAGGADR